MISDAQDRKATVYRPLTKAEWKNLDDMANRYYEKNNKKGFDNFSDRSLIELWKRCIYSKENPWGQDYDDEVADAIARRPNAKELFEQAKKEYKNEFTSLKEEKLKPVKIKQPKMNNATLNRMARGR